jgi:hypothetical protein
MSVIGDGADDGWPVRRRELVPAAGEPDQAGVGHRLEEGLGVCDRKQWIGVAVNDQQWTASSDSRCRSGLPSGKA